jgi:hypothetical protein
MRKKNKKKEIFKKYFNLIFIYNYKFSNKRFKKNKKYFFLFTKKNIYKKE